MANGLTVRVDTVRMEQIIDSLPGREADLLAAIATEMVGDMVQGMDNSPRDGREYTRGGVTHVASSPGNAPRPDTGELKASIDHEPTGDLEHTIFDQVEYGVYLELGTEFMEARPWMTPVFEQWRNGGLEAFVRNYPLVE